MVVVEKTIAHLDLIGCLCVEPHEDEKEEGETEESANRRKQVL